ncbi:hypothetical protein [Desulfofustis limnaeus]|uniref:hypothetical protein n=1 Tax=Desulfofustis limnaeus TaxID=2740163 RepID=UPI0024DF7B61|nr:hypothetical protein [Desulfofustis limnaeus]
MKHLNLELHFYPTNERVKYLLLRCGRLGSVAVNTLGFGFKSCVVVDGAPYYHVHPRFVLMASCIACVTRVQSAVTLGRGPTVSEQRSVCWTISETFDTLSAPSGPDNWGAASINKSGAASS